MEKQHQHALYESAASTEQKTRVAIIGSGLAGLATAHLLQNDDQERFEVSLFEQGESISLDAASVTLKNTTTGVTERVNIPQRSVNRGYYPNLGRMYDYLRVPMRRVRFTFIFAEIQSKEAREMNTSLLEPQNTDAMAGAYLVFENLYKYLSSPRFNGNWVQQLWQMIFLTASYIWLLVACHLFEPRATTTTASTKTSTNGSESLYSYLRRMRVPRQFVDQHLLPVLGAVCTCSHEELSNFPASDIVNFMKKSALRKTYVTDGVHEVQSRLLHGITDVRLQTRVNKVDKVDGGLLVKSELLKDGTFSEEMFDRVVLAVTPNVVARIFKPASRALGLVPTAPITASIIDPSPSAKQISVEEKGTVPSGKLFSQNDDAQIIALRTGFAGADVQTEAWHYLPSGAISTTSILPHSSGAGKILHAAQFTRTLRTVESRMAVQQVLREGKSIGGGSEITGDDCWVSGQDNVWVAGSWCWDGMVLLEGCAVSAMRVADEFGVKIPW